MAIVIPPKTATPPVSDRALEEIASRAAGDRAIGQDTTPAAPIRSPAKSPEAKKRGRGRPTIGDLVIIQVSIPLLTKAQLEDHCAQVGDSVSGYIRRLIIQDLRSPKD
jgi:hypothetical protein